VPAAVLGSETADADAAEPAALAIANRALCQGDCAARGRRSCVLSASGVLSGAAAPSSELLPALASSCAADPKVRYRKNRQT